MISKQTIASAMLACVVVFSGLLPLTSLLAKGSQPNILIVTVDDMSCDSVGAFGCKLKDTTPNIDKLAAEGLLYQYAHVQTGSCYPSRNVMFSGRYSHNTGVEGFYQVKNPNYPHMVDLMKAGGYFVGIRGKVSHSTPYQPYAWDDDLTIIDGEKQDMKNPHSYYVSTKRGIELAKAAQKPFCLNINISDPHKPFYALSGKGEKVADKNVPTRVFDPKEVPIPGFLFDHPEVRKELAHYYSSVRRADDCVGEILKALDESKQQDNTAIIFLSDHGMPLPFAKTAVWYHSTRTPLIVKWPGFTKAGSVDDKHMVSAVDLLPTILDIAHLKHPQGFDGKSFLSTIDRDVESNEKASRDYVYTFHNENSGRNRSPMRSVQSKRFGYIFNPWSDGERVFKTATTGTATYRAMKKIAGTDEKIAARLDLFEHRVPEEFYDYQNDPDAMHNLIDDPKYADEIETLRSQMRKIMQDSNDPLLAAFKNRDDPQAMSDYVDKVQAESDARRKNSPRSKEAAKKQRANRRLFQLEMNKTTMAGSNFIVTIQHKLRAELGEQEFHVTLKDSDGKRIERIVTKASGKGTTKVTFKIPAELKTDSIIIATFVGKDYANSLLHLTEGPITVSRK